MAQVTRASTLLLALVVAACTGQVEPLRSTNDAIGSDDAATPAQDGGVSDDRDPASALADGAVSSPRDGATEPPPLQQADAAVDGGETPPGCTGELCPADITFFAMGDAQYGGGAADKNYFHVSALNDFPGRTWPEGMPSAGTPVAEPRGLLMAGDITQNGKDGRPENHGVRGLDELGQFLSDYGLTGDEGLLRYPVYEGYGNHDFDPSEPFDANPTNWRYYYPDVITPSVQAVIDRNEDRPGLVNVQADGGHYSWDWGGVHFVNVNLFPGNEPSNHDVTSAVRNPFRSLDFLARDLATYVGGTCRPVIIMSHFGFSGGSLMPVWWKDEQREAFWEVAKNYNVIAYVHGHQHDTSIGSWNGMDYFNVGSPFVTANVDRHGHFSVFRIHDNVLEAADARWDPEQHGAISAEFPVSSAPNSGWRFSKQFRRTCEE